MSSPFDLQLHAFHRGWLVNVPLVRQNEPISNTTAQNKTHLGMFLDTEMVSNDASLWQDGLGFNGDAHHGLLPANVPTLADVSAYDVVESFGDTAPLLFNPFLPVPESADIALAIHFDSRISSLLDAAARNPAIIALPSVQNAYRSVQTLECWRQGMREFAEKGEWYRLGEIALNPKKWALMPKEVKYKYAEWYMTTFCRAQSHDIDENAVQGLDNIQFTGHGHIDGSHDDLHDANPAHFSPANGASQSEVNATLSTRLWYAAFGQEEELANVPYGTDLGDYSGTVSQVLADTSQNSHPLQGIAGSPDGSEGSMSNPEIRHEGTAGVAVTPQTTPRPGLLFENSGVAQNDMLSPLVGVSPLHRVLRNAVRSFDTPGVFGQVASPSPAHNSNYDNLTPRRSTAESTPRRTNFRSTTGSICNDEGIGSQHFVPDAIASSYQEIPSTATVHTHDWTFHTSSGPHANQ